MGKAQHGVDAAPACSKPSKSSPVSVERFVTAFGSGPRCGTVVQSVRPGYCASRTRKTVRENGMASPGIAEMAAEKRRYRRDSSSLEPRRANGRAQRAVGRRNGEASSSDDADSEVRPGWCGVAGPGQTEPAPVNRPVHPALAVGGHDLSACMVAGRAPSSDTSKLRTANALLALLSWPSPSEVSRNEDWSAGSQGWKSRR